MSERSLAKKVTYDFNEGCLVTTVEVAHGAVGGGWGVTRVDVTSMTPVRPDFLEAFLGGIAMMVVTGGIAELIALHDAQDNTLDEP